MNGSLVCAGASAGASLPLGCWWTRRLGSFLPKPAQSVLRKTHLHCSFCLHCTSQQRAPCLHQGWALWGPMGYGEIGASQFPIVGPKGEPKTGKCALCDSLLCPQNGHC